MTNTGNWPNDADGDVLRSLASQNFNFEESYLIDFNVDFKSWPPPQAAILKLETMFGELGLNAPKGNGLGYVFFQVNDRVSYERVISIQSDVSRLMAKYGGVCESWGIYH